MNYYNTTILQPQTPERLKKLQQRTNPGVGESRAHFITAPVKEIKHGKKSTTSLNVYSSLVQTDGGITPALLYHYIGW